MEVKLFETITAAIPDAFKPAGEDTCKAYFGTTPLDYAFATEDNRAAIGIVRTDTRLTNEMVENQIAAYQQHYSRMVPGFTQGEMRKNDQIGRNIAFMSFKSNAPMKDLYNILAITTLDDSELILLFSCDMCDAVRFVYVFLRILESLSFSG